MAKRTISENRAISQTIDRLRLEGLEENRATVATFRMFRERELDALIRRQRSIEEKTAQEVKVERMMIDDMVRRIRREKKRRRLLQAAIAGIVSKITG